MAASAEEASRAHPAQPAYQRHQAGAGRRVDMVDGGPTRAGTWSQVAVRPGRGALPGSPDLVSRVRGSAPGKCEDFCRGD